MRKILLAVVGLVSILGTVGCNTVHGLGQDIKKSGEAIEKAANK